MSQTATVLPAVEPQLTPRPIDPGVRIGHVHLKVADLDRALAFYCGVLGFELKQRFGNQAAFLAAGGYHHHIGLNTWESKGGSPPPRGATGLYHVAILYPSRAALADALKRLLAANVQLDGAADHGVSGDLPARSRRKRRRALPGPSRRRMATQSRRDNRDDNRVSRSSRASARRKS